MSTRQPYDYALERVEAARAAAEAQRRSVELARLRAERAASIHAQGLALSREHERARSAQLGRQARALEGQQAALGALSQRAQAAGFALNALEDQVRESGLELERTRAELRLQMDRLAGLERDARLQEAALAATLAEAEQTLGRVESLQSANAETLAALIDASAAGRALGAGQSGLEDRIRQLEAEVSFVTQRADLSPVAMVTLQAMESNGYRLQGTLGREELVVYFQKESAAHQIAVRMAPIARPGDEVQRWDLLAETFDMKGETCLGELDDFETAVEERGLGRLRRKEGRVYPRDDSQALLPKPARSDRRRRVQDSGSGIKGHA
ncbi:MAG TPA: hypothetical protein VE685_11635 [Thermoanaerobaculia bacterium]|nr:hypothetical protein [Thermoanaerobaculia bacterium]